MIVFVSHAGSAFVSVLAQVVAAAAAAAAACSFRK